MNELLFFLTIVINFSGILIAYKIFNKMGLFIWIAFASAIVNIEVVKSIDLFGMSLTLGNVLYSTTYLATDILSEIYGKKEARKGVAVGFFAIVFFTILTQINLLFIPNQEDFTNEAMHTIFSFAPRICLASLIAYLISNTFDTYIFEKIKNRFPKHLWLRNNLSTLTSQIIDTILFTIIAFYGVFSNKMILQLIIFSYIIKVIIALCDTPFIYIAKKINASR